MKPFRPQQSALSNQQSSLIPRPVALAALAFFCIAPLGHAQNRLKDKTEATSPANDDWLYLDGTTNGVRKLAPTYYQPKDSDLTSIAALSTTSFGRSLLTISAGSTGQFLQYDGTWASPSASVAWGAITGTLSSQSDLTTALAAKDGLILRGSTNYFIANAGDGTSGGMSGTHNNAFGNQALKVVGSGSNNTAGGYGAGTSVSSGSDNALFGKYAGLLVAGGSYNSAFGADALAANVSGVRNSAFGKLALTASTADENTGVGYAAGYSVTTATNVVAMGYQALHSGTTGASYSTAIGSNALFANNATNNTALGYLAGYNTSTGGSNTFIGTAAGYTNSTGAANVFLGAQAGRYLTAGNLFAVNNQDRTDASGDQTKSLLYGTFNATETSQTLRINGVLSNFATTLTDTSGKVLSAALNTVQPAQGGTNLTSYTLGDTLYSSAADTLAKLAGNTTSTKNFLTQTGTGSVSAAPAWGTIVNGDVPTALTGKTYNGLTLTANATGFSVAGGTTSKTLTVSNTLTLAGTDSSTLNIGSGGTLGTAAYTASSAYQATDAALTALAAGSDFVQFTGPSSTTKVFTLPNATATILTSNAAVTAAQGGTSFTTYTLGDTIYSSATNTLAKLAGNTTSTKKFLTQTGNGSVSAAPAWGTIADGDLPSTLTNKRITARVTTISSSATPTINTDTCDCVTITALAAAITSMTTNLSGTPNNFDQLQIRIKDDGTARAITWGASFASGIATLPTTTTISKVLTVWLEYDSVKAKWVCMSTGSDS